MAKVRQRAWTVPGQRTKRKAWGFVTVGEDGKQVRVFHSEWTCEDAEKALSERTLKIEQPKPKGSITFGEAVERYLAAKSRKRSLAEDERILGHLKEYLGKDTTLADITAARIAEYKGARLSAVRKIGEGENVVERRLTAAAVNRPLALLRHLLRLAHEEWEALNAGQRVRLEKEPQGRLRWLTEDEITRLLDDDSYRALVGLGPKDAGRVFQTRYIKTAYNNAVSTAKLDDVNFHTLRHTFASWAVMRGVTLKELQELLGHASLAMTMRYAHLAPEHLRTAVSRLEGLTGTKPAEKITQEITQEPLALAGASQNSS